MRQLSLFLQDDFMRNDYPDIQGYSKKIYYNADSDILENML